MVPDPPPHPLQGVRTRFPALYGDLRRIAARMIRGQPHQSLSPGDLTHEAYEKLTAEERRDPKGCDGDGDGPGYGLGDGPDAVFKACFAAACRDVLVDRARHKKAVKRGGDRGREPLPEAVPSRPTPAIDILEVDDAIAALEQTDPVAAEIARLRVFGDLSVKECAEVLGVSPRTVDRKWSAAREWLGSQLGS